MKKLAIPNMNTRFRCRAMAGNFPLLSPIESSFDLSSALIAKRAPIGFHQAMPDKMNVSNAATIDRSMF